MNNTRQRFAIGLARKVFCLTNVKDVWSRGPGVYITFEYAQKLEIPDAGLDPICMLAQIGMDVWFDKTKSGYSIKVKFRGASINSFYAFRIKARAAQFLKECGLEGEVDIYMRRLNYTRQVQCRTLRLKVKTLPHFLD